MTFDHKKSMFLNVTPTIGCWKGTAMEFIKSTDSSNGTFVNTVLFTLLYTNSNLVLLLWKAPWQDKYPPN